MKNVTRNSKKCEVCGLEFQPSSNRQKYCTTCKKEKEKLMYAERHKRRYQKKGYNQKGENNNNWKHGESSYYKRIAYEAYGKVCNRCGSLKNIVVHHKDRNRKNNDLSNLEVLCKKCHQLEHEHENNLGEYLGQATKERDEKGRFATR